MKIKQKHLDGYIENCKTYKNLDWKTVKAYRTDVEQYLKFSKNLHKNSDKKTIVLYIKYLQTIHKPRTIKRKIASLKAFFEYMIDENNLNNSPFSKIRNNYCIPLELPRTMSIEEVKRIVSQAYNKFSNFSLTGYQKNVTLMNIVVLEMLFATGMRVSELCALNVSDINLDDCYIRIMGKGSKERLVQIENSEVLKLLQIYFNKTLSKNQKSSPFLMNRNKSRLSEQSIRTIVNKYANLVGIKKHITPHMFRHTLATLLLEKDVDIRYIQQLLGHSSIVTTQIYTHVSMHKQKEILKTKHPRNNIEMKVTT
jgi:integrase/recombinase XerD